MDKPVTASSHNLVSCDKKGQIYITGLLDFYNGQPGGGSITNSIFYKFSPSGILVFQDTLSHAVSGMTTDGAGNTYMVNADKIYKYDSTGAQIWTQSITGKTLRSVSLNPMGGISVYGWGYMGSGNTSTLAKVDVNGNLLWVRNGDFLAGGSLPDPVACDNAGNTYATVINGSKGLLVTIPDAGNSVTTHTVSDWPQVMTVSEDLSVYIAGKTPDPANSTNRFIRKYSVAGNIIWSVPLTSNYIEIYGVAADKNNNVMVTGIWYKNLTIGSVSMSTAAFEMFVAYIDSEANVIWIKSTAGPATLNGGSNGMPTGTGIVTRSNQEVLVAGQINGQHSFDNVSINADPDYADLFVCKLNYNPVTAGIEPQATLVSNFQVYPSPTNGLFNLVYENAGWDRISLVITNYLGQPVYKEDRRTGGNYSRVFDLSGLSKGVYFVAVRTANGSEVRKIVLE